MTENKLYRLDLAFFADEFYVGYIRQEFLNFYLVELIDAWGRFESLKLVNKEKIELMTAENSYLDIMQDYIDINRSVNNYDAFELTKKWQNFTLNLLNHQLISFLDEDDENQEETLVLAEHSQNDKLDIFPVSDDVLGSSFIIQSLDEKSYLDSERFVQLNYLTVDSLELELLRRNIGMKIIGNINLDIRPSVRPFIKKEILNFIEWFENTYDVPEKVLIIITGAKYIYNLDAKKVSATCFIPYDEKEITTIKVSTGDFYGLLAKGGKDDAVYSIIHSILHELQHYYQGVNDWPLDENEADEIGTDLTYEYVERRGFIFEQRLKSRSQKSKIPKFKRFL